MKVAIIHDYIKEYGGAERVLEVLHDIWPDAPVYTTVFLPQFLGPHAHRFKDWDIRTSSLQKIPFINKLISPARIITPWIFENLQLIQYDLIIVSATGAYFPNLIMRKSESIHICYCHTPPRYLYGYPTARNWKNSMFFRIVGEIVNHSLRGTDFISAQRPDYFIANSYETRRRIAKFYRREATVIYPPVDLASSKLTSSVQLNRNKLNANKLDARSYYLAGGRLARPKRIDLAIEACNKLKIPLKIFGREFADYGDELKQMVGPTIEFLGEVDDKQLALLFQEATALIYPAQYEDFGILPVEAQAYGVPVIALRQGGLVESIVENKTGIFFDEPSSNSLIDAIKKFEKIKFNKKDCFDNAKRFSKERFKREIKDFVNSKLKSQNSKLQLKY